VICAILIKENKTSLMNIVKITEIELVRLLKPPIPMDKISCMVETSPKESQESLWKMVAIALADQANTLNKYSLDTAQIAQVDGLANFLRSNPEYLRGFDIDKDTQKIIFNGVEAEKGAYGFDLSPIDILSSKLSENFNYRYNFEYKFLLTALKKALKLAKHQGSVETVEYVDRVITKLLEGTRKARITVSEILKDTQGLDKKVIADSLVRLGWTKQTYKNGAVFYLKP